MSSSAVEVPVAIRLVTTFLSTVVDLVQVGDFQLHNVLIDELKGLDLGDIFVASHINSLSFGWKLLISNVFLWILWDVVEKVRNLKNSFSS